MLNLLRCGIKNVIAVEGTSVPQTVKDLSRGKTVTVFTDGDRAVSDPPRDAPDDGHRFRRASPRGSEVEELTQKALLKCLRNKIPINQYLEMSGFESTGVSREPREERSEGAANAAPSTARSAPAAAVWTTASGTATGHASAPSDPVPSPWRRRPLRRSPPS